MEEVWLREAHQDTPNMSKQGEFTVNRARWEIRIHWLGVDIAEHAIVVVILPGALFVRRGIIFMLVQCTPSPTINLPLEKMYVAKLWTICKQYCYIQFLTPEVTTCKKPCTIPAVDSGMKFLGDRLVYLAEYSIQLLTMCLPLLIQSFLRIIAILDCTQQESDHYITVHWGYLADLGWQIANCHISRPLSLVASEIHKMCHIAHENQWNQCISHCECWLNIC